MPTRPSRAIALALLTIACHDAPTAPAPTLKVALLQSGFTRSINSTADGPVIVCRVTLTPSTSGTGTATWGSGVLRYYAGPDRTAPVDSAELHPEDLAGMWGATIPASKPSPADWTFTAGIPFEVEFEARYRVVGAAEIASATTRFACGDAPPAGGVAAPTISSIAVTPSSGELVAGASVDVTYTASSPYALWMTVIETSGAFTSKQTVAESLEGTSTRTVRFTVPRGATYGEPLVVRVTSVDASYQQSWETARPQLVVVDRTAPKLSSTTLLGSAPALPSGQFAVGERLPLNFTASDEDVLRWVVVEIGAPVNARDSLPLSFNFEYSSPGPIVKPEWVGAPTVSFYVRDAAGNRSASISSLPDSVRFFPTATHPTTLIGGTLSATTLSSADLAHDLRRNLLYLSATNGSIAVLDPVTSSFRAPIPIVTASYANLTFDLTVSGDSLVVTQRGSRTLRIVNLAQPGTPVSTVPLTILDTVVAAYATTGTIGTSRLRVAANGKAIVSLLDNTTSGDATLAVDLATGRQAIRTDARAASASWTRGLAALPDRSKIASVDASCRMLYLAATDSFTPCRSGSVSGLATINDWLPYSLNTLGSRLTFGTLLFDGDLSLLGRSPNVVRNMPYYVGLTLSPDGAYYYVGANGTVTKVRVADGVYVERFTVPIPAERLYMSPDGQWMMVFDATRAAKVDLR